MRRMVVPDDTAFGRAFRAAGVEPWEERLLTRAKEAWRKWESADAVGARRDHIRSMLSGEGTWALMQEYAPRALGDAINSLLRRAQEVLSSEKAREAREAKNSAAGKPAGRGRGGHGAHETHGSVASPAKPVAVVGHVRGRPGHDGEGHSADETQDDRALSADAKPASGDNCLRRPTKVRPQPTMKELSDKHRAATLGRFKLMMELSKLDTFIINGQKIGDLTPEEANGWAASRERDARFVRLLTANLPPNRPIREFVTPGLANDLFERAQKEMAA